MAKQIDRALHPPAAHLDLAQQVFGARAADERLEAGGIEGKLVPVAPASSVSAGAGVEDLRRA